jgi:thiol-disulfide isomerase/thioredoxin
MKLLGSFLKLFLIFLWFAPAVLADTGSKVGSPAPPLALKEVLQAPEGIHGTWGELKGKAVVIEFWATWCGGCVENIPHINELAEQFASRPLQFISITDETDVDLVKRFLARHPIRGWIAFDADENTFKTYGIEGRPQTLLVDRSGVVQAITNPISVTPQVLEDC